MKVLVTCPPMLRRIDNYRDLFEEKNIELHAPNVVQTMTEEELKEILPGMDGWIIGDDPANRNVFQAGVNGKLKAAVKWGVGVDNVDFVAAKDFGIPITNTPGMFGEEVSDVAIGLLLNLSRKLHLIDREVRVGNWYKPAGMSLKGKKAGVVGYGDIGKACVRKLEVFGLDVISYDPFAEDNPTRDLQFPDRVEELDLIVFTCALTEQTYHMFNAEVMQKVKADLHVINVARGPIIDEKALVDALRENRIKAAGLDVFEHEPLAADNPLIQMENVILGSHNGSNTVEAVDKTSFKAISLLFNYLGL